jgi:succinate dehydrogenase/fumarate reductase cytochrome b subunit
MFILMDREEKIIAGCICAILITGFSSGITLVFWNGGQYYVEGAQLLAAMACLFTSVLLSLCLVRCCQDENE